MRMWPISQQLCWASRHTLAPWARSELLSSGVILSWWGCRQLPQDPWHREAALLELPHGRAWSCYFHFTDEETEPQVVEWILPKANRLVNFPPSHSTSFSHKAAVVPTLQAPSQKRPGTCHSRSLLRVSTHLPSSAGRPVLGAYWFLLLIWGF